MEVSLVTRTCAPSQAWWAAIALQAVEAGGADNATYVVFRDGTSILVRRNVDLSKTLDDLARDVQAQLRSVERAALPGAGLPVFVVSDTAMASGLVVIADSSGARIDASAVPVEHRAEAIRLAARIEAIARRYEPATVLSHIDGRTDDERGIAAKVNDTDQIYPRDVSLASLFDEVVDRDHDAPALRFGGETWSFGELQTVADAVAVRLVAAGLSPGAFVGLRARASVETIAALLGIVKAGAVYVPIDVEAPPMRQRLLAQRARLRAVIDNPADLAPDAPDACELAPVRLEVLGREDGRGATRLTVPRAGTDPLYVLFTSGTTGMPKGVVIPHRGVARLACVGDPVPFAARSVTALTCPLTFDVSAIGLWGSLLNGGLLVGVSKYELLDANAYRAGMRRAGVDLMIISAGLFNGLISQDPACFSDTPRIYLGGEAPNPAACVQCLRHSRPEVLDNCYGPTEASIFASVAPMTEALADELCAIPPIGRPLANSNLYILDPVGRPLPPGARGEIAIGGDGLALEYFAEPEQTARRFAQSDAMPEAGRLYRTGDLGRMTQDGCFEYFGRIDDQVKISGHRVEPEEVQAVLSQASGVGEAAVAAITLEANDCRLAAYVRLVNSHEADWEPRLRAYLAERLPSYMTPNWFVRLDVMPKNRNGKLDRKALPDPRSLTLDGARIGEDDDPVLKKVLAILRGQLKTQTAPSDRAFRDLGGNSLLAARFVRAVEAEFGAAPPLSAVMTDGSAKMVAAFVSMTRPGRVGETAAGRELRL